MTTKKSPPSKKVVKAAPKKGKLTQAELENKLKELQDSQNKLQQEANKKKQALEAQIEAIKNANKPKSIMDRVKTFNDVLKIAKPTKEELAILNYKGKSQRILFLKHAMHVDMIHEALNEGWKPKMDGSESRHYPWFYLAVASGFVFADSSYHRDGADTGSAARLCLKTEELANYSGREFKKYHENLIKFGERK